MTGGVPVLDSKYNRRISPATTVMSVDGPAAGHDRMKTSADPSGMSILGTLNNCAGGLTPWGTYLTAEENFHGYFWSDLCATGGKAPAGLGGAQAKSYERYGVPGLWQAWGKFIDRFNVDKEPNEPNRFGWIVEIDPLDPNSVPVKHTALGRFWHEGAETHAQHGWPRRGLLRRRRPVRLRLSLRLRRPLRPGRPRGEHAACCRTGTLSVAKFDADGSVAWLPLVLGQAPLTPENGFASQAEVLIDARLAADAARRHPHGPARGRAAQSGHRQGLCDAHQQQGRAPQAQEDDANPRADNEFGHIIEMTPPDGDHAADAFRLGRAGAVRRPRGRRGGRRCGIRKPPTMAGSPAPTMPRSMPRAGCGSPPTRASPWPTGRADGLYALETEGARRRTAKLFFRCPVGAEMCGPCFTPDQETLFVAVQHPGADATDRYQGLRARLDLRRPGDPLAGFRSQHAAAALGGGHQKDRRRQDRLTRPGLASLLKKPRTRAS